MVIHRPLWVSSSLSAVYHLCGGFRVQTGRSPVIFE
jgi:hypothetical protein